MKNTNKKFFLTICWAAAVIFLFSFASSLTQEEDPLSRADALFRQGHFSQAAEAYKEVLKKDTGETKALVMLGQIALFRNDFAEAEALLKKALSLNASNQEAKRYLAEAYYRQNRFTEAAPFFADLGQKGKAEKLKAFENRIPYQIEGDFETTEIKFLQTDPLPLIPLSINDKEEAIFLIDTGGWELILETGFAEKLGIKKMGEQIATYAGGLTATTYHGIADSVRAGDFLIRNVPVNFNDSPKRIAQMMGKSIRGVVGTCFLYHFIFTLDYPAGKLILRKQTPEVSSKLKAEGESSGAIRMPFWMAGDHFIVTWGTVNNSPPLLFFVDTGLAGGGFTCPEQIAKEVGIQLGEAREGIGGGGKILVRPIKVNQLSLGNASEENIPGSVGALTPDFEYRFGFRMGGIISHVFFKPYRVTFDFLSMCLYLGRASNQ